VEANAVVDEEEAMGFGLGFGFGFGLAAAEVFGGLVLAWFLAAAAEKLQRRQRFVAGLVLALCFGGGGREAVAAEGF
jgi:hypothetical protein